MPRRLRSLILDGPPLGRPPLPLGWARFIARPNRFVAEVEIGGRPVKAHLPNPGRLTGTLSPGCALLVDGPFGPPRRLPYAVVAIEEGAVLVGAVPVYGNRIFPTLWRGGLFPELGGGALVAEVTHGRSRFDFRVGERLVEVKSVTLARAGLGLFPDAVTARGARHCLELAALARAGHACAVVFVAQRGDVERIAPEEEVDPRFAAALREAGRAGVALLGCAVELTPGGARLARRVPIDLGGGASGRATALSPPRR